MKPTLDSRPDQAAIGHALKWVENAPPVSRWTRARWWVSETASEVVFHLPRPIRHAIWSAKRWWHAQVTTRLFPRQRWLTRQISRDWEDKTTFIPTVLFAAIVHFVEEEDCFGVTDWPGSGLAAEEAQLKAVYAWAKTGRAAHQARIEAAHPPLPPLDTSLEDWLADLNQPNPERTAAYKEVWRLEAEMTELDRQHMTTIVSLVPHLWT